MKNHYNILDGSHNERQRKQERREDRLWLILMVVVALYGIYHAV
jgi:hypothetical protein